MPDERCWLVKTAPDTYSIGDLERDGTTEWDGIRNYAARNHMREMRKGDPVLIYHSSTDVLGVYGIGEVAAEAHPDSSQFRKGHPYYDPDSDPGDPRWSCVDLSHRRTFRKPVTRDAMRERPELAEMKVLRRGMRLSVMPVTEEEYRTVVSMAG